jgi:hypothetical protein
LKQFLTLEGAYAGKQVRRLKKFGRIELLRVFHDPEEIIQEPYWFVRIAGFDEKRDQDRATRCSGGRRWGNGYWRFCHLKLAQAKFDELAAQPESVAEEGQQQAIRAKARERMTKRNLEVGLPPRNGPRRVESTKNRPSLENNPSGE